MSPRQRNSTLWVGVLLAAVFGLVTHRTAFAQTTYTWNRTGSSSWATSTNWTPTRSSPASSDILVINGTTTPTPTLTNIPNQTIGRLRIINNASATLTSAGSNNTVTISGATGPQLEVQAGATLTISGNNALRLSLGSSATASISGNVVVGSAAHQLLASAASAITFTSTGRLTTSSNSSGNVFGSSGTANIAVFQNGSIYTHGGGSSVFGLNQPNSKVVFQAGSTAIYNTATGYDSQGRVFANLQIANNATISSSGSNAFQFDSLRVNSGSSFTHSGSGSATITVRGNISSAGTGSISITPGSGGIQLNSGGTQIIGGGGGTGTITFGGNATVSATTTVAVARTLAFSTGTMTVNGTFRIDQGGFASGTTNFVYGAGATLLFNNTSGSFGVNSTHIYWPSTNSPPNVTVQGAGGITMNAGATRTVSGTFQTAAAVAGANLLTFTGTVQRNAGGSFGASPVYSGTPTLVYTATATVGNEWGSGGAVGSGVPRNVTIQAGAGTVTMPNADRTVPGNLTLTSGTLALNATSGNLLIGGNWTNNAAFTPNGRTVTFNGAGNTQTVSKTGGETFWALGVDKTSGNVQLLTAVTVNGTTGNVLSLNNLGGIDLNGQTLTLSGAGGTVLASGTTAGARTITGTGLLALAGAKTVSNSNGRTLTLANARTTVSAAFNFGSGLTTVNGVLEMLAGGSVATNPPIYASGAILRYPSGGTVSRGLEWSATSGAGYPHHVEITSNTTLDLGAGGTSTARQIAGNLTIATGSTLTANNGANAMTAAVTVLGNVNVDGTLTLSALVGGNLGLGGNLAVTGTFTANAGGIVAQAGATQTLSRSSGSLTASFVRLTKSGGSVQLLSDLTLTSTSSAVLFDGTVDVLDLNGRTATLSGTVGGTNATGAFRGTATSRLVINGSGAAGTVRFAAGGQTLDQLTVNRTSSGSVTLGSALTVNGTLTLTNGVVTTGTNTLALGPTATIARTSGWVNGKLSKRAVTGSPVITFEVGTTAGYTPITVQFGSVTVAGDVTAQSNDGEHPQSATSGIDGTKSVNRWYNLTGTGLTFDSYSATFNFLASDVDGGATPANFEARRYVAPNWNGTTPGTLTATSTQVTGVTAFGDFAVGELRTYTITASAGTNGIISPSGAVVVRHGKSRTFTMIGDQGYHVEDVRVNGLTVGAPTSYTFTNVTANQTIQVSFAIDVYPLTISTQGNGTASASPNQPTYVYGTFVTLTATPGVGWDFSGWDGGDFFTTENPLDLLMERPQNVTAVFVRSPLKYVRSTFNAAWAPLGVGATTLMSADDSTRSIPMPFPFNYSGLTFTTSNFLAINANGFAFPSRSSVTASLSAQANNANLITTTVPNLTMAPWYDDLSCSPVGSNPAGSVLYRVQGSAPNRNLTVQWDNASSFSVATNGQPRRLSFQLKLYETTNVIEFLYGPATGSTYSTLESASIGLEDSLGGNNGYIDAVIGSRVTYNSMLTSNKWPVRHLRFTPGAPVPIPAGTYDVGGGGTYPSLSEAVADVNYRGISGPITLRLTGSLVDSTSATGGNMFPILLARVAGTSATNTITIQPASGNATIRYRGTESGICGNQNVANSITATNEPILGLIGTDHVTLRNLIFEGGPTVDRGLLLISTSTSDGAQNNTVRDVTVRLNRANTSSIGIQQSLPAAPTLPAGANSGNRYHNLVVENCYAGISLAGNSIIPDDGCQVGVTAGGSTVIGGSSPGDIGGSTVSTFGIRALNQSNVRIWNADVRNLLGTGAGAVDGIVVDNLGSALFNSGTCEVFGNRVHGLDNTSPSAGRVSGIRVNLSANASSISRVYNNFVYGLNTSSTSSVSRRIVGILLQDAAGGAGATHNVDFNSVRIAPMALSSPNTCFEIGTTTGPVIKVRDNVFANFVGTQSGSGKHYCWVSPGATIGPAGSVSDRNVLHINNLANGYTGLVNSIDRVLLTDWQSATGQDANAASSNPQYVSDTDLHINTTRPTPVESHASTFGGTLNWVSTDIDGDVRHASTPDVGADEGTFNLLVQNDVGAAAFVDPAEGEMKIAGSGFVPRATFENSGSTVQTNVPVRFRLIGPLPSNTVAYDQGASIGSISAGASQVVTFPNAVIAAPGFYTMQAVAQLANDQNHGNDQLAGTMENAGPLSGTINVGAASVAPFNTLTGAITRLMTVGVSGATTLRLMDAVYAAGETFPIVIGSYAGASAANRVTIRPGPGVNATVSGGSSRGLIELNGADYVTIDGSNTVGGTTRNLTLFNFDGSVASAVVWGQTASAGTNPVTNCVVANAILRGSVGPNTLVGVGFAGPTISIASVGQNNNANTVDNCKIERVQYGVYTSGHPAFKNTGTVITRNNIDTAPPDNVSKGGILARFENGITISENKIADVVTAESTSPIGIALGLSSVASDNFAGDEVINATVTRNRVDHVESTSPNGLSAAGITLATATSGVTTIANNMVSRITSPALDPDMTVGIVVGGGSGSTTRLYFNSVYLSGARGNASSPSFALAIGGTNPTVDMRDNILMNTQTTTGPGDAYAVGLDYTSSYTNLTSNYNDLYTGGPLLAIHGGLLNVGNGDLANLTEWRSETGKDGNSISANPLFVSTSDVHIRVSGSPVANIGTPIAGVTTDWDGEAGNRASTPDLGADEFATFTLTVTVVGSGTVTKTPNLPNYVSNDVVQLSAAPAAGYQFAGWSGDATGTTNPLSLLMDGNKSVTATFTLSNYTLNVTTTGSGSVAKSPNQATYTHGTNVTLTANPSAGHHFDAWSGDATGSANPISVVMNSNKNINAAFAINTYTLNVTTAGSGTVAKSPDQPTYNHGTSVTLTATPAPGYQFSAWSGGATGSTNPLAVTMTANTSITATFVPITYTLTANVVGGGTVAKSPNQATYAENSVVQLSATPNPGYHFTAWSGDTASTSNPILVTMTRNKTVTATFVLDQHELDVTPTGHGTVNRSPDQSVYDHNTVVQLTAVPEPGHTFIGWSGDATGSTNPLSLTMDAPKTIIAKFTHVITTSAFGHGSVSRNPSAPNLAPGTVVEITATPDPGHSFVEWAGDASGSTNPLSVTIDEDKDIVARFTLNLNVTTNGNGTVAKSPNLPNYAPESVVQLTATGNTGYHFVSWSGDASGSENPLSVTVDSDKNVTATFEINTYPLALARVGAGAVAASPNQASYDHGSSVQVTATPDPGHTFLGWSGDASGSTNPLTVSMTAAKSITASFTRRLDVTVVGNGSVAKAPDLVAYGADDNVTLTASPAANHHLVAWSGDASGSTNPLPVTMTDNKSITATFAIDTHPLNVTVVGNGAVGRSPDQPSYDYGTNVTLTPTPAVGWHFVGWSGDATGAANPLVVSMTAAKNITATFAINTYTLTLSSGGNGAVAKSPDQAQYDHGTQVTVTATPDVGYNLLGWSGDATGSENPLTVTMDGDKSVTATFANNTYPLTVSTSGSGAVGRSPDQASYVHGSVVTLTANPATGWHFLSWSGDASGSTNPTTLTMDGPKSVTATFEINAYTLDVTANGSGTVTKSPDQGTYPHGTPVSLTPNPATGWHFTGWSGDASGSTVPLNVTMTSNKTIVANFAINTYTLSLTAVGSGSLAKNPDQPTHDHGTQVNVTATPNAGYHFDSWSGDASGSANPLTVTMDGNKSITGTFMINTYALGVTVVGNGSVAKSPDQPSYDHGTSVTLTAEPPVGWHFVAWSGDASGSANPVTVVMNAAKNVTATFAINTYPLDLAVSGGGAITKSPDQAQYDHGTAVTLTAVPATGSHFVGWSGDATGATNPIVVDMTGPRSVTATFAINTYTLNVGVVGGGSVAKSPNQGTYEHGTPVLLTPTPDANYHFVGWSGDASGNADPLSIVMDANKSVTATFAINTYTLAVTSIGSGTVSKAPDQPEYEFGATVLLSPNPGVGHSFVGWGGDASGNADPLSVYMNGNKSVTASFAVNTYPVDVMVVGSGSVAKSPNQATYDHGTLLTLTATPAVGHRFVGWSGDATGSANPVSLTVDGAKSVTATFEINTYTLDVTLVGGGTVSRSPDQALYNHGTNVTLTAQPNAGYHLVEWSGDATGSQNPLSITMDANKVVTATFAINTYTLGVTTSGSGTVTKSPDQPLYDHGTQVVLTANPAPGWHLVAWSGAASGTLNPTSVIMDGNKSVSCTFAINTYPLTLSTVGSGAVVKAPDQPAYDHGTVVTVTANASTGWNFTGWSGDASGTTNPLSVTMDAAKSITANFAINTYTLGVSSTGNGTVARDPDQPLYDHGSVVSVIATPTPGYHLVNWSGDATGSANPLSVTMDGNKTITATFAINIYSLGVTVNGSGTVSRTPNQSSFEHGTVVRLQASSAAGFHFDSWGGDASGTSSLLFLTMDGNKSVTATFVPNQYTLSITAPNGSVVKSPDQATYGHGETVQLTAMPDAGYHFRDWLTDASGTQNPVTITMNDDKNVVARFQENTFTITVTPSGGSGSVTKYPDQPRYDPDTKVDLFYTPANGFQFVRWTWNDGRDEADANPISLMTDSSLALTAYLVPGGPPVLTTQVVGDGTVTRDPDQSSYAPGTMVYVTATPSPGWQFVEWTDDRLFGNPAGVFMDRDKTVTAVFAPTSVPLTVSTQGSGTVARNPDQPSYDLGSQVQVTATPAAGWHFMSWSGDATGSANPLTITMNAAKSVTAHFGHQVNVAVTGSGTITRSPNQMVVTPGTVQTLTAVAAPGFHFAGWGGDTTTLTNTISLAVNADRNLTARFTDNLYSLTLTADGGGTATAVPSQPSYPEGSAVELRAMPQSGWRFVEWREGESERIVRRGGGGGECPECAIGTANPLSIEMFADRTITAVFETTGGGLVIATDGAGTVLEEPVAGSGGTELEAIAEAGWKFVAWSGDAQGTAPKIVIPQGQMGRIVATFVQEGEELVRKPTSTLATIAAPVDLAITRLVPNPTAGAVNVDYAVPREGRVRITVIDAQGREVARLVDGRLTPGRYQAAWNGKGARGDAPAGVYFVRLIGLDKTLVRRLVITR